ncbi:MAG: polysaccharide deacetylase family protein [Anaerolineales bacterium]|nr:polysaccharide deacetylase family protein [Anaerolineales bacterium]
MKKIVLASGMLLLLMSACTLQAPSSNVGDAQTPFGVNPTLGETATLAGVANTSTLAPTATATSTSTLTASATASASFTPTPASASGHTATPTLVYNPPGELVAPILLYYHIAESDPASRYYVSPDDFQAQMAYLRDQGYTSITVSELTLVLINGGELPARPVVITFDDGDASIYESAFPIMGETGFVGVVYLTGNRLYSDGFLAPKQLSEMTAAGWQVGSQGMTHQDLTTLHDNLRYELLQSRLDFEDALGVRVTTFAYPFGLMDGAIADKLQEFGYYSAVGLGESSKHTWGSLYYLSRIEVQGNFTLEDFSARLP